MQAYQQYIDDIQSAVYSPETADPDFLRDSAAMYAEACAEVNDRLRSVGRLLHRGLRSEAIQLAEQEPNLLDMVAMLDFQELSTWREMLVDWEMAEPPRLLIDLAADLNKAYADQQPLESLLRQHRILALARAPLCARITTLRRIRDADDRNDTWTADLVTFEKARLKQISIEADAAQRTRDLGSLSNLANELRADGWMVDRPKSLIETVESARTRIAAAAARKALERIDIDMNAAHMAFDVAAARSLRSSWQEAAATAGLLPNEELAHRAAPALEWLAEQDRQDGERQKFASAIDALQRGVDEDMPGPKLRRLYEAALRFEEPVPTGLARRVDQRIGDHDLHVQRRSRLTIGSAGFGVLLLCGVVAYFIMQQAQAKRVSESAATLTKMIDDARYADAERYFDDLRSASPKIALSGVIQEQKTRLDGLTVAESERSRQFATAVELAEKSPPDSPDRQSLLAAKKLARSSEERDRVAAVEAAVAAAMQKKQQAHDTALAERLTSLREALSAIEKKTELRIEERLNSLSQLRLDIEGARKTFPMAAAAMLAQADPLVIRIDTLIGAIRARERQADAKDAITSAVGDFDDYLAQLASYAKAFPDTALATNRDAITAERVYWDGLLEWSNFLTTTFDKQWPTSAVAARAAIAKGDALDAKYGAIPLAAYYRDRKPYLVSIAAREPDSGDAPLEELRRLFRDPLISKLWMVSDKLGPRFYMRKEPVETEVSVAFDYLAGFDLTEKKGVVQKTNVIYKGPAPQSEIAAMAVLAINEIPTRGWESSFARVLRTTADPKRDIDPILRLVLLQRLVDTAVAGSSVLDQGFRQYREALGDANVDLSVPWMAPRDNNAAKERQRAQLILDGLPSLDDATAKAAERLKELRQPARSDCAWIGWLSQDSSGDWVALTQSQLSGDGDLVIVTKPAGAEAAEVSVIGTLAAGKPDVTAAPGLLVEGRPVFFRRASK